MSGVRAVTLATCALNQWAMDFEGNLARVKQSIDEARAGGARFRTGPELEIPGYGCEDHFLELDTFLHSWQCVADLISSGYTDGILVDVGMPVMHHDVPFNCRVFLVNRQIVFIRPKLYLADDGNYRESRWFRPWSRGDQTEDHLIPGFVSQVCRNGQTKVPFGHGILLNVDDGVRIASETCEELFTCNAPNASYMLNGVDIIANGSGSHHNMRKLHTRIELLTGATRKGGGVYLYANQIGCDGGRLYYDGCSLIVLNGQVVQQGSQFIVGVEVETRMATLNLGDVSTHRNGIASRGYQAAQAKRLPVIEIQNFQLIDESLEQFSNPRSVEFVTPQEEIAFGPACWLWDYLRRSGMKGFLLPLSGGADSSSTAAIVYSMCSMVFRALQAGNADILFEIRRIVEDPTFMPLHAGELADRLLCTCYMASANASSSETRARALDLAKDIGCYHIAIDIGGTVDAALLVLKGIFPDKPSPKFKMHGGSTRENLALQNIQARVRMVLAYLLAQLVPWARGRPGTLLVLGSANVDEGLRGYLTKYDCSSADINPIGGISKADLKDFLLWASRPEGLNLPSLRAVIEAKPTAELEPLTSTHVQTDEEDMGMTYDELTAFGRLRKLDRCGPLSMFLKLTDRWRGSLSRLQVAEKVKFFFRMYSINRHKMTTLTPSYHAENYSPDDNRFDLRQFLYNPRWTFQFRKIDEQCT